jgi:hypothetical protein
MGGTVVAGRYVCSGSTGVGEGADMQADWQNAKVIKASIDLFNLLPIFSSVYSIAKISLHVNHISINQAEFDINTSSCPL